MRIVDADALKDKVIDLYTEGEEATEGDRLISNVIDIIDDAPTITDHSVELVKKSIDLGHNVGYFEGKIENERPQGEWIKAYVDKREFWFCKKCEYPLFNEPKTNFCPNCGAKMKGGAV